MTALCRLPVKVIRMWLIECPNDDEGLLRPAVTRVGQVILLCDSGGEVWLDVRDVSGQNATYLSGPAWSVGDGIDITPPGQSDGLP